MRSTRGVCAYAAWHQMVPICLEPWFTEANETTLTHFYNPVAPTYPVWTYYVHGRERRCQEDPVSLPSGRLEKTTRSSLHHMAQHRPTWSETTPSYFPRSSRFGSEPPLLVYHPFITTWLIWYQHSSSLTVHTFVGGSGLLALRAIWWLVFWFD